MNIDKRFLDQCDLLIGPAISLANGEDRQRVLTLSPFAVPMDQGICLLQSPGDSMAFYGVSLSDLSLGIPESVVGYIADRCVRENHGNWKLLGYGLGLTVTRSGGEWQANLGSTPLAAFRISHVNGNAQINDLQLLGLPPLQQINAYTQQLATLITRYL